MTNKETAIKSAKEYINERNALLDKQAPFKKLVRELKGIAFADTTALPTIREKIDAIKYLCDLRGDLPDKKIELSGKDGEAIKHTIEVVFVGGGHEG